MKARVVAYLFMLLMAASCTNPTVFFDNFNQINNRIWIGKDYWSIPMEDWKVEEGKLYFKGEVPRSRVNLLTHIIRPGSGEFEASVIINLNESGSIPGSAGFLIGLRDKEDQDVRAACYFGEGIPAGISAKGYAFLGDTRLPLPPSFDFDEFNITIKGNDHRLKMEVTDRNGLRVKDLSIQTDDIHGLIALVTNIHPGDNEKPGNSSFSFDNLKLAGTKTDYISENSFGPILWAMHTINRNTAKLMAVFPPIGQEDNHEVTLQIRQGFSWQNAAVATIEPDSRTAVFRLENWDSSRDTDYRLEYIEKDKKGNEIKSYYTGTFKKDPGNRPLKLGALTCQFTSGFPYSPLVRNLNELSPDLLYFSGDQIYEPNGGYPAKREPEDVSILNYLGKYYMFGWAFGDLMRDRPTICTPDDHDVFHGNLWGEGGIPKPGGAGSSDTRGFMQSVKMVNVVNQTQCGHLPDPYDPSPIEQGMSVWYTGLTYGRISFAIISDRIYKTGPERVSSWDGRHDHLKDTIKNMSSLNKEGITMIGDRQMRFLNDWILDWENADMKVLLSQTLFANVATHHGNRDNYLYGDLDSGGWPKAERDSIIRLMRKVSALHINGDQHLPTLVQYGLENYCDAGWSFNTPAICNYYLRWFLPDELGVPVEDRPEHEYPNTGKYADAFENLNYVYAVGNPGAITIDHSSRYNNAQLRSSGFGMITFNKKERTIKMDAWRFYADVKNPNLIRDQFPGWPVTISQFDNLGMNNGYRLPKLTINQADQLIKIINEETSEIINVYRIGGNIIQPSLHENGIYTIVVGEGEKQIEIKGLKSVEGENTESLEIEL